MSGNSKRIHSLDYLRGLAACGIMFYHFNLLSFGEVDSSNPLAKIKIYAVAIFFILSGLTLYKVYNNKLSVANIRIFYFKRILRIVPLLWLVTIFTLAINFQTDPVNLKKIILNFTILPGILKPEVYSANGAWSIGNECGFYVLFPILLILANKKSIYLWISFLVAMIPFLVYTYNVLDPNIPLGLQWRHYVSPLAQFLFFIIGMLLGTIKTPSVIICKLAPLASVLLTLIILFYPSSGEPIALTVGNQRIIFTILTTLLCYCMYIGDFSFLHSSIANSLTFLGEISYSLYLLHPIIFECFKMTMNPSSHHDYIIVIVLSLILTPIASYIVYNYFEKYFINLMPAKQKVISEIPV